MLWIYSLLLKKKKERERRACFFLPSSSRLSFHRVHSRRLCTFRPDLIFFDCISHAFYCSLQESSFSHLRSGWCDPIKCASATNICCFFVVVFVVFFLPSPAVHIVTLARLLISLAVWGRSDDFRDHSDSPRLHSASLIIHHLLPQLGNWLSDFYFLLFFLGLQWQKFAFDSPSVSHVRANKKLPPELIDWRKVYMADMKCFQVHRVNFRQHHTRGRLTSSINMTLFLSAHQAARWQALASGWNPHFESASGDEGHSARWTKLFSHVGLFWPRTAAGSLRFQLWNFAHQCRQPPVESILHWPLFSVISRTTQLVYILKSVRYLSEKRLLQAALTKPQKKTVKQL